MATEPNRLREHPRERFAPSERIIDLDDCFRELLEEPHEPIEGHRQIAIARRNNLTLVAFHFEEGALVDGQVTIQVLQGRLLVRTRERTHRIDDGQLLVLAPGVRHDLRALRETRMLLTVYLDT
jgi:quercetin dioxygenase-like cupin family protein